MKPEVSISSSQEAITGPYPKPAQIISNSHTCSFKIQNGIVSSGYSLSWNFYNNKAIIHGYLTT